MTGSGLVEEQELLSLMVQGRHRCRQVLVRLLRHENSLKLNLIIIKCEVRCFLTNRRHALHLHLERVLLMLRLHGGRLPHVAIDEGSTLHHGD